MVQHYFRTTKDYVEYPTESSSTYEIWVDKTGQLVQHRYVLDERVWPGEQRPDVVTETLSVISGVGEPNFVTAPIATPTPKPTLDPDTSIEDYFAEYCISIPSDYDFTVTSPLPGSGLRWDGRVSGEDSHIQYKWATPEGIFVVRAEEIRKDGVLYTRDSLDDDPTNLGEWSSHGEGFSSSALGCIPQGVQYFTTSIFLSDEEGTEKNEYWLDADGLPTRLRKTVTLPNATGPYIVIDFVYSGYGEPNVITAPDVSSP